MNEQGYQEPHNNAAGEGEIDPQSLYNSTPYIQSTTTASVENLEFEGQRTMVEPNLYSLQPAKNDIDGHVDAGVGNDKMNVPSVHNFAPNHQFSATASSVNNEEHSLKVHSNSAVEGNVKIDGDDDDDGDSDIEVLEVKPAAVTHQPQHVNSESNASQNIDQRHSQQQTQIHGRSQQPSNNQQQQDYAQGQYVHPQQQGPECQERVPYQITAPPDFVPTWGEMWPEAKRNVPAPMARHTNETRAYRLSLLSSTEFTVTAVMHFTNSFHFQPTLFGLRKPIKEICRTHASKDEKAIMEDGRWRIPLSIYHVFLTYLNHEENTYVHPIPPDQIKIASLGKAAAERGYPSPNELMKNGVPEGLATALAPYQRGGVDFVMQRNGRALIADEMGLGKTVQGIAAMACFGREWPLLVLSPSTARYHWEAEFLHWLGKDSAVNQKKDLSPDEDGGDFGEDGNGNFQFGEEKKEGFEVVECVGNDDDKSKKRKGDSDASAPDAKKKRDYHTMELLQPHEINVLTTSSDIILRHSTKVVIVSYGLIANLVKRGALFPGQFKCIIVDESHMLKNKKSKRTMSVMPLLKGAYRAIMLSGTPALSKPQELFPQLNALGAHKGWWNDEEEFHSKYVKDKYSDPSFQELHALLTSTVMIRRLKNDILKDMPSKLRENVFVDVRCPDLKDQITEALFELRNGKGVLGKLSVLHQKNLQMSKRGIEKAQQGSNETDQGKEHESSRRAALNKVFQLTGKAKIPILIDMLKRWLDDPTKGKLCIFAHHIAVLDALVQGGGLSNDPGSNSKFIRIDGSTNPRFRQDQITLFQNDPSVRIAVLGVTAAGVGVTLTAASTIWFAELFWTPALLIQAEDRCHRIGQQARVRCLYTIAKGTLDEVLWILVKRKFQALGEFVEGREMMEMVVHSTYHNEFDAVDRKCQGGDGDGDGDDDDDDDDEQGEVAALADEGSFQHDLEELAKEGIGLNTSDDDCSINEDSSFSSHKKKQFQTSSENNDVICLSDDEEEDVAVNNAPADVAIALEQYQNDKGTLPLHLEMMIPGMNYFYMFWFGQRYGLHFIPFCGRIIVSSDRPRQPFFASIIVAVNNWIVPHGVNFQEMVHIMKSALQSPPVRLMFGQNDFFSQIVRVWHAEQKRFRAKNHVSLSAASEPQSPPKETPQPMESKGKESSSNDTNDDVIEILDD